MKSIKELIDFLDKQRIVLNDHVAVVTCVVICSNTTRTEKKDSYIIASTLGWGHFILNPEPGIFLILFFDLEEPTIKIKQILSALHEDSFKSLFMGDAISQPLNNDQDNFLKKIKNLINHLRHKNPLIHYKDTPLTHDIERILNQRLLYLAYQPIQHVNSKKIFYFESLVRFQEDNANFIQEFEKAHMIQLLDRYVLEEVLAELWQWPQVSLSLNVAPLTLKDKRWLDVLTAHLKYNPSLAQRLWLEITETSLFPNIDEFLTILKKIAYLGCRLSIDDFGSGFLSLTPIQEGLIHTIKIDRSLIQTIHSTSSGLKLIHTLSHLCVPNNIMLIAEGVEHQETYDILAQETNVQGIQGYLIGRPSPKRRWRLTELEFI